MSSCANFQCNFTIFKPNIPSSATGASIKLLFKKITLSLLQHYSISFLKWQWEIFQRDGQITFFFWAIDGQITYLVYLLMIWRHMLETQNLKREEKKTKNLSTGRPLLLNSNKNHIQSPSLQFTFTSSMEYQIQNNQKILFPSRQIFLSFF